MCARRSNPERTAATRRALTGTARRLFVEQGYPATTLAAITRAAGVTTGALYHHWSGKEALLAAVVHDVYADLARRIATRTQAGSPPVDRLLLAGDEFLAACVDPRVARLILLDAPAALGYERWSEIDERWWLAPTAALVREAAPQPITANRSRLLAVALLGCLTTLGREAATAPAEVAAAYAAVVRAVLA
ncbi:MAG TPA: TetR/AcrR family transcriptional regulator [Pseudonocardia sp.]|jgi:AcrR family transcriptional regulator|nr:TetR/AcrR family transcriptional regulator [Pseudonocardia sp.]